MVRVREGGREGVRKGGEQREGGNRGINKYSYTP